MKLYDFGLATMAVIIAVCCGIGFFSAAMLQDDNVVEEVCEEIIQVETGIDVDLSPKTKESEHMKAD